jgi:hypothetical protein
MGLIELILSKETKAPELVQNLMQRTKTEVGNDREKQGIIDSVHKYCIFLELITRINIYLN